MILLRIKHFDDDMNQNMMLQDPYMVKMCFNLLCIFHNKALMQALLSSLCQHEPSIIPPLPSVTSPGQGSNDT